MTKTKYNISFTTCRTKLVVTYVAGKFKRLDYLSGGITNQYWRSLNKIIPYKETSIAASIAPYNGRVMFTPAVKENPASTFTQAMASYFEFFKTQTNLTARVTPSEGSSLKQILKYLTSNGESEEKALRVWKHLLANWNDLEPFYSKRNTLKQINSNLTTVLTAINNPKSNFPSEWSKSYEKNLAPSELTAYWQHLKKLGFEPIKDGQMRVIKWRKNT